MPRIPRHSARSASAAPSPARGLRRALGALIAAGGTLLWMGQAAHQMAAS